MSVKIRLIEMNEGDHFIIRLTGNAESAIAIRALDSAIQIAGPANNYKKEFLFSQDGVRELKEKSKIMDDS